MSERDSLDERGGRVFVGPPPPYDASADDVLPAVVKTRSDGARRYICYTDSAEAGAVAATRISVDADAVVERELWR